MRVAPRPFFSGATLRHPLAMMIAPSLSGMHASIDSLLVENGTTLASGLLTLASPNPMTLLRFSV
ncbi:hypothetical protein [Vreelandella sp. EE22]